MSKKKLRGDIATPTSSELKRTSRSANRKREEKEGTRGRELKEELRQNKREESVYVSRVKRVCFGGKKKRKKR